jgi:hypothetical protein
MRPITTDLSVCTGSDLINYSNLDSWFLTYYVLHRNSNSPLKLIVGYTHFQFADVGVIAINPFPPCLVGHKDRTLYAVTNSFVSDAQGALSINRPDLFHYPLLRHE